MIESASSSSAQSTARRRLAHAADAVLFWRPLVRHALALHAPVPEMRAAQAFARWYEHLNPAGLLYNLYLHRHLLRQLTRRDIESRYRGSSLGLLWALVTPLLLLAIYTFVFSVIFQARWQQGGSVDRVDFAITLFAGLIAFGVFTECVNRAPLLITGNPNYVKRVVFPLEVLPVTVLGSALFHALISMGVLVAGLLAVRHTLPATILLLPVAALPLVALSLGTAWFLASLGVYLRDTANAVSLVTQMLFFLTPLFYPIEAVPAAFRPLLWINPLSAVVDGFRRVAVFGQPLAWLPWAAVTAVSLAMLLLGYAWFMKTKIGFANVI
jgi:lipopolysaccharide transport system permease protein